MKSVIIVAAGQSNRYGKDKLGEILFDKTVLQHSVDVFRDVVDEIVVVGQKAEGAICVEGGKTRSQSVALGLKAVSQNCQLVAIHDGARPFVSKQLVMQLFAQAKQFGSAVPRLPITDTTYRQTDGQISLQDREQLFTVQTPQVFCCSQLKKAFAQATREYTDESTLYFETFGNVHFVDGEYSNKKITVKQDLPVFRVGEGFDVHPFGQGNGVILGGVTIPFDKKLVGHSDADVLAHAICDALLSASGNKDIGTQFPDTDDKYLGADSMNLLAICIGMAKQKGFCVQNVSAVVICQQPKIAPYIDKIAENLSKVLEIPSNCVNLSATTTEKLGALGNGDGIACQAVALLKGANR